MLDFLASYFYSVKCTTIRLSFARGVGYIVLLHVLLNKGPPKLWVTKLCN
jgi:hypothetical protein